MKTPRTLALPLALGLLGPALAGAAPPARPAGFQIAIATKTLPNGLTVVVSEDHSSPDLRPLDRSTASASASSRRDAPASPTSSST